MSSKPASATIVGRAEHGRSVVGVVFAVRRSAIFGAAVVSRGDLVLSLCESHPPADGDVPRDATADATSTGEPAARISRTSLSHLATVDAVESPEVRRGAGESPHTRSRRVSGRAGGHVLVEPNGGSDPERQSGSVGRAAPAFAPESCVRSLGLATVSAASSSSPAGTVVVADLQRAVPPPYRLWSGPWHVDGARFSVLVSRPGIGVERAIQSTSAVKRPSRWCGVGRACLCPHLRLSLIIVNPPRLHASSPSRNQTGTGRLPGQRNRPEPSTSCAACVAEDPRGTSAACRCIQPAISLGRVQRAAGRSKARRQPCQRIIIQPAISAAASGHPFMSRRPKPKRSDRSVHQPFRRPPRRPTSMSSKRTAPPPGQRSRRPAAGHRPDPWASR